MSKSILLGALILPLVLLGCSGLFRSAKPTVDKAAKAQDSSKPAASDNVSSKAADQASAQTEEPKYNPPGPSDTDKLLQPGVDSKERAEVNQAALDYIHANNIRGLKHMKTCYSKLYGGWYMLIYTERGKKASMQNFGWNPKTKEWEPQSQKQGDHPSATGI